MTYDRTDLGAGLRLVLALQDEGRDIHEAEGVYDFGTAGDAALYGMFLRASNCNNLI